MPNEIIEKYKKKEERQGRNTYYIHGLKLQESDIKN